MTLALGLGIYIVVMSADATTSCSGALTENSNSNTSYLRWVLTPGPGFTSSHYRRLVSSSTVSTRRSHDAAGYLDALDRAGVPDGNRLCSMSIHSPPDREFLQRREMEGGDQSICSYVPIPATRQKTPTLRERKTTIFKKS